MLKERKMQSYEMGGGQARKDMRKRAELSQEKGGGSFSHRILGKKDPHKWPNILLAWPEELCPKKDPQPVGRGCLAQLSRRT